MILSASRRTDIPAFYSGWLLRRLKEGYVLVRNPVNPRRISKISLAPDVVDGIVFWTKDPVPMLKRLDGLRDYPYYFQFTLNAYGKDAEPNVPSKNDVLVPAFRELSRRIGKDRVVWRYDPIFFSAKYTPEYHVEYFGRLASLLAGCTETCTVSFLDYYRHIGRNLAAMGVRGPSAEERRRLMALLVRTASARGMKLTVCAEEEDYSDLDALPARCVDRERLERLGDFHLNAAKDKNQRPACGCCESVDIGAYGTCLHGCRYCYADRGADAARSAFARYDPASPLLCGTVGPEDTVTERKTGSCRDGQLLL